MIGTISNYTRSVIPVHLIISALCVTSTNQNIGDLNVDSPSKNYVDAFKHTHSHKCDVMLPFNSPDHKSPSNKCNQHLKLRQLYENKLANIEQPSNPNAISKGDMYRALMKIKYVVNAKQNLITSMR